MCTFKDLNKEIEADLISVRQKSDNDIKYLTYNFFKKKLRRSC